MKRIRPDRKEYHKTRYKNWRQKASLEEIMFRAIRDRATRAKIQFLITVEDIKIPEYCPIFTWIKLEKWEEGKDINNSPSVDRINPLKPYTKDNIQIISYKANRIKNNASFKELILLGRWAESNI